jgi:hypothetical protein
MPERQRKFALAIRQALLMIVDAIEELLDIRPRTSELRRFAKNGKKV